ncbi:hypothetical protein B5F40_01775 [Gordonibacter sp. An230]|uniref:hypothetical protein n=1 Tax=Gordonibacter sp. An230 TaxID=1965592 RepID=UPI000B37CC1C|nr:hypothetical protein [Gordonibacter sp. An230]OUO92088.1 hypothetical protein B5F40_01775 [Gordonibacter sp. An230]
MRTLIRYTNGRGESMAFGGGSESLHYLEHGLRDWEWSHSTGATSGRVTSFAADGPKEVSFPVGIAAATPEEGIELRNRLLLLGEPDIDAVEPGTLEVPGGWKLRCWIVGGSAGSYWMDDRYAEFELTLLVERPVWTCETLTRFEPAVQTGGGVDAPFDFPFDFQPEAGASSVDNGGMFACDWLWRVYGPATSPYVRIGENLYKVNVDVPDGARLEVDTAEHTVRIVMADGTVEDAYAERERGGRGSGTYLFERIPAGTNRVTWDGSFFFDVVLRESRIAAPYEGGE